MTDNKKPGAGSYILFPAVAMMLGWGLRGYIGGGPFGAMIPGAMVAICISMLLKLPVKLAPVVAVFGVVGIGLGGEMTYGQTLGFLLKPETMWWGTLGTTVKGSVWGLLGGIILSMGLIYKRLPGKLIIVSIVLLIAGMLIGFKLINQPMIIYFSDPARPRPESWGALLVGAVAMLIYLGIKTDSVSFRIVSRFAMTGTIGGGLGFGLGGFWMVLGSRVPDTVIFSAWWKAMEFTFGLILGGFLGYAAWINRKEIAHVVKESLPESESSKRSVIKELIMTLLVGILVFWAFAAWLDPIVESANRTKAFTLPGFTDIAILFSNYAFYGLIMVAAIIYFPASAWQIAVSLTFCHTVIDLSQDIFSDTPERSLLIARVSMVLIMTAVVAVITAWFQYQKNILNKMFQLLTWSTVTVAFLRFFSREWISDFSSLSLWDIIFGHFFVQVIFLSSAVIISLVSYRLTKEL